MEAEGDKCNTNKDCASNICRMIYRGGNPVGRRCLNGSGGRYTKACFFPKDCQSGICEHIYDASGKSVAKQCIKATPIDRDNPMDRLLGKTSSYEKGGSYGVLNDHAIKVEMGEKGPITEVIVKVISVVFDIFTAFVYNFRKPSYNLKEQGMLYSIFASVALNIFYGITNAFGYDGLYRNKTNPSGMYDYCTKSIHPVLYPPVPNNVTFMNYFSWISYKY